MKGVGARRPSRVTGIGHDLEFSRSGAVVALSAHNRLVAGSIPASATNHPGIISMLGSQSVFAALTDPLVTRSTARETKPQRLPGVPIEPPSRCNHAGVLPGVGGWETSRCSTRGLFFNGGRVVRAPILTLALRAQLAGDALREVSQRHPGVGALHAPEVAWSEPACLRSRTTEKLAENRT